jgi:creatinine amidohydrolase
MADRLGTSLIAPTIQYVPEGNYDSPNFGAKPGVITNPGSSYTNLLEAAARSLRVHGFTDILFIGDSGGNQGGMTSVAEALNAEWEAAGDGTRVFSLNDYYSGGRDNFRAYLLAEYGYDNATVGSHAGISDTSQMMWIHPDGIRMDKRFPGGGSPDAGVTGDPTLATADIGRMGIEFKVNAALDQYRTLKRPAGRRGGRGGRGGG